MDVKLNLPIIESIYSSHHNDSLADIEFKYDGARKIAIDVCGTDQSYEIKIGVLDEHFKTDVVIEVLDGGQTVFHAYAHSGDFDIPESPDDELLSDWRGELAPYFHKGLTSTLNLRKGLTSTLNLDHFIDTVSGLPVLSVWGIDLGKGQKLVIGLELVRSLTVSEAFVLARLGFSAWDVKENGYELTLIWD